MEKIENFSVVVPENYDPSKPIIIQLLEGSAPNPVRTLNPQKISLTGDITAPKVFALDRFERRGDVIKEHSSGQLDEGSKTVLVTYMDKAKGPWIKLETDPSSELNTTIKGELKPNPDLNPFHFNKAKVFTNDSFMEVLKENGHCFKEISNVRTLIKSLQNFVAKFSTEVEKLDDKGGNTKNLIQTTLDATKSNIPTSVDFFMPMFSGGPAVEFTAEVEIDVVMEGGAPKAKFGLFCLELTVKMTQESERIVAEEIAVLNEFFTCIRVES